MEIVALAMLPAELRRQRAADRSLAATGHTHHDDDRIAVAPASDIGAY